MKSIHRQFGKLKSQGDSTKVSVLLNDYEDANRALKQLVEASKGWRDAWINILGSQLATVSTFEELYNPIVGTSDEHRDFPTLTPQVQMERTTRLKEAYTELKTELYEEIIMMDARVTKPAVDAIDALQPMRKIIKKRENKRLDWERQIDKVNNASKKMKRTDKENAVLAKAEQDLAITADEFKVSDDHIREVLPPLVAAAFSILPHLMSVQIMIQNTLLAQYYTALHNYCEEVGFSSPAPPMDQVISTWERDFKPAQRSIESITCIARGKTIHQPMSTDGRQRSSSTSGLGVRSAANSKKPSAQTLQTASPNSSLAAEAQAARQMLIPSSNSIPVISPPSPAPTPSPEPTPSSLMVPDYSSQPSAHPYLAAYSPAGPSMDYFQRSSNSGATSPALNGIKKKPPPPPPKRAISNQNPVLWAVALYGFEGQGEGDLSFREGDKIKVVKKTGSMDDWWDGELRGVRGTFPANYCKLV